MKLLVAVVVALIVLPGASFARGAPPSESMDRDGRVTYRSHQPPAPRYHFQRQNRSYVRASKAAPRVRARVAVEGARAGAVASVTTAAQIVGGRPTGCPNAFCGCGVSLHIFGRIIGALNLAANWAAFPRAEPAPGMVAVRRHHVFAIESVVDRTHVIAYDPNSGGHKTRIHLRSLQGYSVHNPQGGRG